MSQSQRIVTATKQALRERGLTYADVAHHLGLSEASVKRLFARGQFSLERLEAIAGLMGLDLAELVRLAEHLDPLPRELTAEQEAYLVERPRLLLVFYLLLNDYTLEDITAQATLDRPQLILLLRDLESIGLVERRLGDRVRLLVSHAFAWRADGPIRRLIDERVLREFLDAAFDGPEAAFYFVSGLISPASAGKLCAEIDRLVRRFNEQLAAESQTDVARRRSHSLLVAMRPWQFSLLKEYLRPPTPRAAPSS